MSQSVEPRWVKPMLLSDELNQRVLQNQTGAPLSVGQVVAVESMNDSEAYMAVQLGVADGTWRQELLFVVGQAIQESDTERRDKFRCRTLLVVEFDTSLAAIGDPVYLSGTTPGAVTLTPPANVRKVGQVLTVGVTGKVVIAPQLFQGFGTVPFTLDQKWRDEFNADWEAAVVGPRTVFVDNVAGSDTTGDGQTVGTAYATIDKAILDVPHHRNGLQKDEVFIRLVHNGSGNPYAWGGQALVGSLDDVTIQGSLDTSATSQIATFTTTFLDVAFLDGNVIITTAALPGTTNDLYKGQWIAVDGYDFDNTTDYAHINRSEYDGGSGTHTLYLSDRQLAPTWEGDLTIFNPELLLTKVNLRPGVFAPGDEATRIYDSSGFKMKHLYMQNLTKLTFSGNSPVLLEGCHALTMAWYMNETEVELERVYLRNYTDVPDHGCMDLTSTTLIVKTGCTMDGTDVLPPDAGFTTGTIASVWMRKGSHVHVEGGLWLRSHAHIICEKGTFHRKSGGYICIVVGMQQGGPGYTVPGLITTRPKLDTNEKVAGRHPGGEVELRGPQVTNIEFVLVAAGHDISISDVSDITTQRSGVDAIWVSADSGGTQCSYDPGSGSRARINDPGTNGMFRVVVPSSGSESFNLIDWARGEDQIIDLSAQAAQDGEVNISFRHPRLGGTHKLWMKGRPAGVASLIWASDITFSAGAPVSVNPAVYQLFVFEYLPDTATYYARHVEVDIT